ncbi:MAG: TIGR03915 family putative DNA repair protein [Ginsengibacter sp.]
MNIVTYDGSFEGFLTAVFEVYEYKINQPSICSEGANTGSLFGKIHEAITSREKSKRVFEKISDRLGHKGLSELRKTFLSEIKDIENVLFRYIAYALQSKNYIASDYSHPDVLLVHQTNKKVHREKHRMEAFVRFQCTKDQLYYAIIQPDYNVLPLISNHFEKRYADQRWLIYDIRRKYGLYYDLNKVDEVSMTFEIDLNNKETLETIFDEKEELYQALWQQYFQSVNIKARKNMKLHIRHMPKRYWKYLVEKQ